ncbi:helix-turn-helix domain-containing protein [Hymenobacter oligotrophus]|uniref:Helix-turn-helix domain-containing protein n=1 Tax=Hymenobacter oligotrophus TaxID=2319843 RepID=A0A3B7QYS7_9BACT|nr:helix-turn-helix transcriptional regulator [Hymenobacter oligotrophus]AYA36240.1 helix-turn-helix domain-containing protein [Hymenobacter oligotrophus]
MVDRIRQLLQARQLTSTQFADAIGVARPIVSHILSGRNKPSLEVVQKILLAFPDLSMAWLLNGHGPMLAMQATKSSQEPPKASTAALATPLPKRTPKAVVEPVLPADDERAPHVATPAAPEAASSVTAEPMPQPSTPAPQAENLNAAPSQATREAANNSQVVEQRATQLAVTQSKIIRRVLIFYTDGTFTDYTPATDAV